MGVDGRTIWSGLPRKRNGLKTSTFKQIKMECVNCYAKDSPLWRRGNYCNRCYCYYLKNNKFKDPSEIYARILMSLSRGKTFN